MQTSVGNTALEIASVEEDGEVMCGGVWAMAQVEDSYEDNL